MTDEFDDEAVGYGRPPKRTRFKPGQSGNPRGRPKKSRNRLAILQDELSTTVVVTENGTRRKLSKAEVILRQLVNKSAGGDMRALASLLQQWASLDDKETETNPTASNLSEAEREILLSLEERMRDTSGGQSHE